MPIDLVDIFSQDAFKDITLTEAVNKTPFAPNFLGQAGIFTPSPLRTLDVAISITDQGDLQVVPTVPRGAPPIEQKTRPQQLKTFKISRGIKLGDTITADELQGILARSVFAGGDTTIMLQDLQSEIAFRVDGPNMLRSKVEASKERMRLSAISGLLVDADDSVLFNWATEFGAAIPAEIDFDLDNPDPTPGALQQKIRDTKRKVLRAAKAGNITTAGVMSLCGDAFFDGFVAHPDVAPAYSFWQAGAPTRASMGGVPSVEPFSVFRYEGIDWVNYRGTDDNETIAIDTDKCKFVPTGIPGVFREYLAPAEDFDSLNQPGLPIYVATIPDRDRNRFVRVEASSYPLYVATRPEVLFSGRRT